jgi:hypothetical protein
MELIRKLSKPIAIFLSFYMLMLACPYHSAWAALIGTDSIINENRGQSPRDYLNDLLAREDLKAAALIHRRRRLGLIVFRMLRLMISSINWISFLLAVFSEPY